VKTAHSCIASAPLLGRCAAMKRGAGDVELGRGGVPGMLPTIQPYQAAGGSSSAPSSSPSKYNKVQKQGWQQTATTAGAVWCGGWFLGYGMLWPLYLVLSLVSNFTPFGGLVSWWGKGAPVPDFYPAATELRIPGSQVAKYVESYVQSYGDAALIFAAHDGYAQLVNGLLASKDLGYADLVDAADESGHTALLYSAGRGFPQTAAVLLHAGADPDAPRQGKSGLGLTPLMEAAGTGHREVIAVLMQANATIDLQDEYGNTALMYAAYGGQLGALQELLQDGAMREVVNKRGDTALAMAAAKGFQAVVDALQRGARPVVEGKRQSRPPSAASSRRAAAAAAKASAAPQDEDEEPAKLPARSKKVPKLAAAAADEDEDEEAKKPADAKSAAVSMFESMFAKSKAAKESEETEGKGVASSSSASEKSSGAGAAEVAAAEKRIKKLEAELAEAKRDTEAVDLKTQRKIVDLMEQSSDKQKLLDEALKQRHELQQKADGFEDRLRKREDQGLEDEQRHTRLSKEAHDARMEAERERARADSAEREKERQIAEARRLKQDMERTRTDSQGHDSKVDRLQAQLRESRREVDQAEEERRLAQRQLADLRAAHAASASASVAAADSSASGSVVDDRSPIVGSASSPLLSSDSEPAPLTEAPFASSDLAATPVPEREATATAAAAAAAEPSGKEDKSSSHVASQSGSPVLAAV